MKKRLLLPFLAVVIANNAFADNVAINNENFPDESFRQYVSSSFDKNHDGILSEEEIESVEEIYVQGINITNLKGIEHFKIGRAHV